MRPGKLTFLGTGASLGVPVVGCDCPVCTSPSPLNKRFRTSCLLEIAQKKILLDCGPDFRQQALRSQIMDLDGVILTHAHFDHVAGIDDIRPLTFKRETPLPLLLSKETLQQLKHCYEYLFFDPYKKVERFEVHLLEGERGTTPFLGLPIRYLSFFQTGMKVNGFVFGDLAFISDIKDYAPSIFEELEGIKTLIISALRFSKSNMHLNVDEALDFAKQTSAEHVFLVHLSHDLDHEKTNAYLPPYATLAYDGLEIGFNPNLEILSIYPTNPL